MPRAQLFVRFVRFFHLGRGSLNSRAQETCEVFQLPLREVLLVDGGLILDKQIIFRLRGRVGLNVDLDTMGWFYGPLGGWVDGTFDVTVLGFMNSGQNIKVTLAELLFPVANC